VARFLLPEALASYTGFDRHPGMVGWCTDVLSARDARFRFQHVDLKSVYTTWDGCEGRLDADRFVFPYPSASFSASLLASVFTHMPMGEAAHYLHELRRVLRPDGKLLLSAFFSRDAGYTKDEVNFFYPPEEFHAAVVAARFTAVSVTPEVLYDYNHNWLVLTPAA
jgi:SAM-dependent methyltransferase